VDQVSVPVDLDRLGETMARYRFAYLLTVGEDRRAHAVATSPVLESGRLIVREPGRRTTTNAAANPAVSLVWPPADPADYSLIVDASAVAAGEVLALAPTRAVLHRAAQPGSEPGATGCASDCIELGA
ncbi:MAG TPA: hypothetical protein VFI30_08180, partial [Nocardioidaceae bacterium]|nr:hypothetical protein [Nocardioidaceae bacterium]